MFKGEYDPKFWRELSVEIADNAYEALAIHVKAISVRNHGKLRSGNGTYPLALQTLEMGSLETHFQEVAFAPPETHSYSYQTGVALAYIIALGFLTKDLDYRHYLEQFEATLPAILAKVQFSEIRNKGERHVRYMEALLPSEPSGVKDDFRLGFQQLGRVKYAESNLSLLQLAR